MKFNKLVERDERTVAVENASYALGYMFLSFALLLDVALRSFAKREAPWDLLAILILSGVVLSVYQARLQILTRGWIRMVLLAIAAAAAAGLLVAGIF